MIVCICEYKILSGHYVAICNVMFFSLFHIVNMLTGNIFLDMLMAGALSITSICFVLLKVIQSGAIEPDQV